MRNYLFDRDPSLAVPDCATEEESAAVQAAKHRARRRGIWAAVLFSVLICALTVTAVLLRNLEGSLEEHLEEAGGYSGRGGYPGSAYTSWDRNETSIARAPAGVKPLLSLSEPQGEALAAEEIYRKIVPSVVSVTAYSSEYGSSGSGVVLSADGYIVTNYHIIEGMDRAMVTPLSSGETSPARLVGYDPDMDLAVLKINKDDLIPAEFAPSRNLVPGQTVYAIGNPMGYLYGTITDGIVSYVRRPVVVSGRSMTLIQTNAALNSGNSGGALVNAWGQVVGITVAKIDPHEDVTAEGLGLAIPISEAKRCINTILRLGEMEHPSIGIICQDWPEGDGALVLTVNPGGPAEDAGLQVGDVILTAGGRGVADTDSLKDIIYELGVEAEMPCTVLRDGEEQDLTMVLQEAE